MVNNNSRTRNISRHVEIFSTFHMSTVVIVYETNSCDGRVGAKPTGQDINGSLSGYYITHLKHRIFFGKMAF